MSSHDIHRLFAAIIEEAVERVLERKLPEIVSALRPAEPSGPITAERLITVAEAAAVARVKEATVRGWVRRGRLQRCGTGRYLRIKEQQLRDLLSGDVQPAAPRRRKDRVTEILKLV